MQCCWYFLLFVPCFEVTALRRQGRIITFPNHDNDEDLKPWEIHNRENITHQRLQQQTVAEVFEQSIKERSFQEFPLEQQVFEPPPGQRCAGRNYQDRRCCTPEKPCGLGEGDCDGPLDGGPNDGHDGCQGDLVCGSNNCRKFGAYYHPKDDCCDHPSTLEIEVEQIKINPNVPFDPPAGQRCRGRNYDGKRCCTPENPCDEGEGDCDGPADGGQHDGHAGCKGDLVCGSNNCLKFGAYFHEKDDCCERPNSAPTCQTISGNYPNMSCIFPFVYRGVTYNECTWADSNIRHNQAWCATQVAGNQYISTHWGNCGTSCPISVEIMEQQKAADLIWGEWSQFGPCSVSCGGGQTLRHRSCAGTNTCPHTTQSQTRSCNLNNC